MYLINRDGRCMYEAHLSTRYIQNLHSFHQDSRKNTLLVRIPGCVDRVGWLVGLGKLL